MTFFSHRPQIVVFFQLFSNFPRQNPLFLPNSCEKCSIHSSKILMTFLGLFLDLFPTVPPRHPLFITAKTAFHHCTFSFITAHFVHHCTLKHALLVFTVETASDVGYSSIFLFFVTPTPFSLL